MKKKILFILHLPPPIHGASIACKYIYDSENINNQFDTQYINLTTSERLQDIGKGGFKKIFAFSAILWRVFLNLCKNKYDLCYVSLNAQGGAFYKDFIVVLILKIFRQNIIYHFHNRGVADASNIAFNRFLYRITFKNVSNILLSPYLFYDIKDYVNEHKVYYCPYGIPQKTNKTTRAVDDAKKCQLLFLGNMMEEKGVFVLIEACKKLKFELNLQFECHFVGAWSDISEEDFNLRVQEAGLTDCVWAHGKKYNEEKDYFFNKADIFVFPTHYFNEALPIVNIEAMQFGLPIVSTIIGGIPDEVLDGVTGYLVPKKDVAKLAEKLSHLINNPILRKQMGNEGFDRFTQKFTLNNYENTLINIFNKVSSIH